MGFFNNSFHSFNIYYLPPLFALQPFASCCSFLFICWITPYPSLVYGSIIPFCSVVVYIPFDNPSKLVDGSHTSYNFPFFFIIFLLFTVIVKPSSFINCLPFSPIGDFASSGCPLQLTTFILFYSIYLFWHKWKIHCKKEPIHEERKSWKEHPTLTQPKKTLPRKTIING